MFLVSITASPALDGHNFAIEPFGDGIGHPMTAVSKDIFQMLFQHIGYFFDRL
jgi:hypothetical protein